MFEDHIYIHWSYPFSTFFTYFAHFQALKLSYFVTDRPEISSGNIFKRPARDACLCMGDLQAPPAPHFVFLITL